MGALFAGLYVSSGSLLLPIAVHIALTVRDLTLPVPEPIGSVPTYAPTPKGN